MNAKEPWPEWLVDTTVILAALLFSLSLWILARIFGWQVGC